MRLYPHSVTFTQHTHFDAQLPFLISLLYSGLIAECDVELSGHAVVSDPMCVFVHTHHRGSILVVLTGDDRP